MKVLPISVYQNQNSVKKTYSKSNQNSCKNLTNNVNFEGKRLKSAKTYGLFGAILSAGPVLIGSILCPVAAPVFVGLGLTTTAGTAAYGALDPDEEDENENKSNK